ncbi:MAG: helix-turn-helix domain-containing protein [Janthinobacterium lividum]
MELSAGHLGSYLRARRELLQPEDLGLVREPNRRVPGLRREEVASLAGISQEYYLRLEQGRDRSPSSQVVQALSRALSLDSAGAVYLERLVRPHEAPTKPARTGDTADQLGALLQMIAGWRDVPAYVTDSNLDVVLSNPLADRLGAGTMSRGANRALVMFSPQYRSIVPDWPDRAAELAGALRLDGDQRDPRLREIVGQLSVRDETFRTLWARQDVHRFTRGSCVVPVEPFGAVRFRWQNLQVPGVARYNVTTLFADAGSQAAGVLAFLGAQLPDSTLIG